MSRIDELIRELCPEGVEFRRLVEVARIRNGKDYKNLGDGEIPVYGTGGVMTTVDTAACTKPSVLIPRKGSLNKLYYVDVPFWTVDTIFYTEIDESLMVPKFLYYFLATERLEDMNQAGGVPSLTQTVLNALRIPVPPLEVQREIVRVLDLFTTLEAELEARRAQCAFYWTALLMPRDGWRKTTLGEIAEVFDGPHATPKKTSVGPWYLSISSLKRGRFDLSESAHLGETELAAWTRRVAPRVGDTLFSYETRLGEAAYWDRDEPAALGRRMGLLRPRRSVVDPRFLTLAYLGPQFQSLMQTRVVHGATVDRIPIADMSTWGISIPPLEEQARIVAILEKFDALVNDLSVGLPAELAARRTQYEHYRDRLLTFREKAA